MGHVCCVSGIDTDIGKSIVTGLLAKALMQAGKSVITQKIVQTGCEGIAEDIRTHRQIMGIELQPEDRDRLTCPYVFKKACSPHLAAELEGRSIDLQRVRSATEKLAFQYDHVILEGAGGLLVPLQRTYTFLDYLEEQGYPVILVSSPRLGSINHTLSALELAKNRGIHVNGIVYNCYNSADSTIKEDSRKVFLAALSEHGFSPQIVDLQNISRVEAESPVLIPLQQLIF